MVAIWIGASQKHGLVWKVQVTKGQIEDRLRELLSVDASMLFLRDGQFAIYSPVGRTPCQGSGYTIQEAIFRYDFNRTRIDVFVPEDRK